MHIGRALHNMLCRRPKGAILNRGMMQRATWKMGQRDFGVRKSGLFRAPCDAGGGQQEDSVTSVFFGI